VRRVIAEMDEATRQNAAMVEQAAAAAATMRAQAEQLTGVVATFKVDSFSAGSFNADTFSAGSFNADTFSAGGAAHEPARPALMLA
jgi:hypothetical protein